MVRVRVSYDSRYQTDAFLLIDTDFRHVVKARDAISMEAQIERLQKENAVLKDRLEQHGLSADVSSDVLGTTSDQADSDPEDNSPDITGKRVVRTLGY